MTWILSYIPSADTAASTDVAVPRKVTALWTGWWEVK